MEALLDEGARRFLQCPEQMLKPAAQDDPDFQPYWDPLLKRDNCLYKRFIRKLDIAGFLVYTSSPKSHCGVFFVKKSDGRRIRMIVDSGGTNMLFNGILAWICWRRTGLPELSLFPQTT